MHTGDSDAARPERSDSAHNQNNGERSASAPKPCLSFIDKQRLESLFEMGGGCVLDFSNRRLAEFVLDVTGRYIYDPKYNYESGSKANRLRAFWTLEPPQLVGQLIRGLLDYYRYANPSGSNVQQVAECERIASRLLGEPTAGTGNGEKARPPINPESQREAGETGDAPEPNSAPSFVKIDWKEGVAKFAPLFKSVTVTPPTSESNLTSDTDELTYKSSAPVSKLDGWTRAELVAQAQHDGAACGKSTFDKIRKAAGIPSAEKGGAGAQRRFSCANLRDLIAAVENGNFRDRKKIAAAWRELLPDS